MVVLENYPNPQEAAIVQGMLEANGIPCVVSDQNNLYVPVFGGVSLLVPDEDLERARQLLKSHHDTTN